MPRRVSLSPAAHKDLGRLSPPQKLSLLRACQELGEMPFPAKRFKRLQGFCPPVYRLSVGDHRVVYQVAPGTVGVLRVLKRSDLERELRRLRRRAAGGN